MLWYLSSSLTMAILAIIVYAYYHAKGQFDDEEDVKYQIFREDEKKDGQQ